ncbi:MAG: hypothetical protein ACTMUB_04905 [cyanobacterium endosymbiont of Rhopalodia musculus]
MNYSIVVVSDWIKAEETNTVIDKASIPFGQLALLGKGNETVDEFISLIHNRKVKEQAIMIACWLVSFVFLRGICLILLPKWISWDVQENQLIPFWEALLCNEVGNW